MISSVKKESGEETDPNDSDDPDDNGEAL